MNFRCLPWLDPALSTADTWVVNQQIGALFSSVSIPNNMKINKQKILEYAVVTCKVEFNNKSTELPLRICLSPGSLCRTSMRGLQKKIMDEQACGTAGKKGLQAFSESLGLSPCSTSHPSFLLVHSPPRKQQR